MPMELSQAMGRRRLELAVTGSPDPVPSQRGPDSRLGILVTATILLFEELASPSTLRSLRSDQERRRTSRRLAAGLDNGSEYARKSSRSVGVQARKGEAALPGGHRRTGGDLGQRHSVGRARAVERTAQVIQSLLRSARPAEASVFFSRAMGTVDPRRPGSLEGVRPWAA